MSKPITIDIPHQLGKAEARKRIEDGVGRIGQQFGEGVKLVKSWEGDRLNFSAKMVGQTVSGSLEVLEEAVKMEVNLPAFFAMMADKVKGRLKQEGQLMLEKR